MSTPGLAQTIVDVRTGVHADKTRFVIELDQAQPYRAFVLTDPDRAVIDLPDVKWSGEPAHEVGGVGLVGNLRYGLFRPGISRVVIDLEGPATIANHFALDAGGGSGPRIVVDLRSATASEVASAKPVESGRWADYARTLSRSSSTTASLEAPEGVGEKRVVVIDPGHGGVDPGAIGVSGKYEKGIVLEAARTLQKTLEATGRYEVVLTRDRDVYLPLRERYQVAHEVDAGLFISLHADSHPSRSLRGASVYTLSDTASDKEAAALARKENKSDVIAGADLSGYTPEVSSILIDLAQQSVNENSWHFAEMLVDNLAREIKVLNNTHRFAGFAVLKSPNVPSVLVELGYLSNRQDEQVLSSEGFRQRISTALTKAIDRFFDRQERLSRS
ncbi:N-acetylmuramoyl-L-alanine amidase [Marivibrio halodurans]|uniref:N-acetylmuramoyl-L-alanine amidase n=1 Tax=Marivibrio halodurans TaxID=2039722 RepID=A0A8J7V1T0_9PROT|nr:N-acetylmuramoyl-L-alanine amidase [Marivibrio halodurans]MBP5856137.1 N-acetylmuramoyl-L-alanine amidase [Marivibrio halodurans]